MRELHFWIWFFKSISSISIRRMLCSSCKRCCFSSAKVFKSSEGTSDDFLLEQRWWAVQCAAGAWSVFSPFCNCLISSSRSWNCKMKLFRIVSGWQRLPQTHLLNPSRLVVVFNAAFWISFLTKRLAIRSGTRWPNRTEILHLDHTMNGPVEDDKKSEFRLTLTLRDTTIL